MKAKPKDQKTKTESLVRAFAAHIEFSENLSRRTVAQYKCVVKKLLGFPLNRNGWLQFLESIADKSPATRTAYLIIARKFLEWCHREGYIRGKKWWLGIKPPRFKSLPHYLTEEELDKFLRAVDDVYYYSLFKFLVNTGLRISEWVELKPTDVTIENGAAYIRIRGKGSKQRVIVTDKRIVEEAVIGGILAKKRHPSTVFRRMKKYLEKAGLSKKASPHTLRHTFAIMALRKGVPLNELQYILGHSSIKTTSIYLQITGLERKIPIVF